jgi:hypothetical protein
MAVEPEDDEESLDFESALATDDFEENDEPLGHRAGRGRAGRGRRADDEWGN